MTSPSSKFSFVVGADSAGERVDRYLTSHIPDSSRAQVQRAAAAGAIFVDGVLVKSSHKVQPGESIEITLVRPEDAGAPPVAEDIALEVIHEDDSIIVINKAAGMVVHPAAGHRTGTIVNALMGRGIAGNSASSANRPGIVHRLDKGTSGLLVCAKTELAHRKLADQLRDRSLTRTYLAVSWGHLKQDAMTFEEPIGRSNADRKKMSVSDRGRDAVTHARVIERHDLADFLEVTLETGRTHQIRVHLSHAGHSVVGDAEYSGGMSRLKGIDPAKRMLGRAMLEAIGRPALHAVGLALVHPESGQSLEFAAPIPADLQALIDLCRSRS